MTARRFWPDLLLVILLTLLPGLFFWRLITPNPPDRMMLAPGDLTEQYFPLRALTARAWVEGRVPLWNPYLYGGQPGLADIQAGALYPPHVVQALILGWSGVGFPLSALTWQVLFHVALASVGMYGFARSVGLRLGLPRRAGRFAAVIAALSFAYSGYLTGFPVQQVTILQVSAWLPWVLWGLDAAARADKGLRPLLGAALAFALAILAGHPQTVLYIFYIALPYTIFLRWHNPRLSVGFAARVGGPWLLVVGLGAMLAAAQLLPTLDFIRRSVRAELAYEAVATGLPLPEFIAILYPGFLGGSPQYVGWVTLVLVALALSLAIGRGWLARDIYFWAGTGLVSLLLAFGGRTFLYPVLYLFLPGFGAVRQQERAFLLYSFSAAMLAAFGAVALVRPLGWQGRAVYRTFVRRLRQVTLVAFLMTGLFIYGSTAAARGDAVNLFFGVLRHHLWGLVLLVGMLALLAIRPRLRRPWGMALVAVWLGFNLFTVNWRFNLAEPTPVFQPDGVVQFLQANLPPGGRIASGGLLPGGHSAGAVYRLPDLTGNTPLQLDQSARLLGWQDEWTLWQLLSVRYVVADRDIGDAGLIPVYQAGETRVYEMGDPFPRLWLVGATGPPLGAGANSLDRVFAAGHDVLHAPVVERDLDLAPDPAATVTLTRLTPNRIEAAVTTSTRQLLVISQMYDPGWQARLNGQAVPVERVNGAVQGVVIPPGTHTVAVFYWPVSFWLGVGLSGLGGIIWALLWGTIPKTDRDLNFPVGL